MANPFPGMDPYLEGGLWPTVHFDLAAEIARTLAPRLRPKYLVFANQQYIMAETTDEAEPATGKRIPNVAVIGSGANADGAATVATTPLIGEAAFSDPEQQITVEVRHRSDRTLVTAIEVLSPSNKRGTGLNDYRTKREQYLRGPAHLLEIDLLRIGRRFPMETPLPAMPYFVFLSRAHTRPQVEFWPIRLDQPLPEVPVPLLPGDPDVELNLQRALTAVHDLFGYDLAVDYIQPPPGPFDPQQVTWVQNWLRAAGRRP